MAVISEILWSDMRRSEQVASIHVLTIQTKVSRTIAFLLASAENEDHHCSPSGHPGTSVLSLCCTH